MPGEKVELEVTGSAAAVPDPSRSAPPNTTNTAGTESPPVRPHSKLTMKRPKR